MYFTISYCFNDRIKFTFFLYKGFLFYIKTVFTDVSSHLVRVGLGLQDKFRCRICFIKTIRQYTYYKLPSHSRYENAVCLAFFYILKAIRKPGLDAAFASVKLYILSRRFKRTFSHISRYAAFTSACFI